MISTTVQACASLSVSKVRLNELARKGKIPRGPGPDQWDIEAIRAAMSENLDPRQPNALRAGRNAVPVDLENETFAQVQLRHEQAKAAKAEMEAKRMEGSLVERDGVQKTWNAIAMTIKTKLLSVGARLAPLVAVESDAALCKAILDRDMRSILEELGQTEMSEAA